MIPSDTTAAAGWSRRHGGADPARIPFLRGWLWLMAVLTRPLVRARVAPAVLTMAGVVMAGWAAWLAPTRPGVALVLVLAAALADGLDGAVAQARHRTSAAGARLDRVADRLADSAFAVLLWRCGAPWWLAVVAGGLSLALETGRALRPGPLVLTVAERPTRVICTALALLCVLVGAPSWTVVVCAGTWAGLGAIALGQYLGRPAHRGAGATPGR